VFHRKKSLTKNEILRRKRDIRRVFSASKRETAAGYTLLFRKNGLPRNQVLIITERGIKSAVKRNREKRITKEIYRLLKEILKVGFDIVLIAKVNKKKFTERFEEMRALFVKANLVVQ